MKQEAEQWIEKANEDIKVLSILIHREDAEEMTSTIGFHCQQAIEKLLKSFLIYHKTDFRKTHDLNELRDKCGDLDPDFKDIEFAVDYRYPDDSYIPDTEEVKSNQDLVLRIKKIVENKIN